MVVRCAECGKRFDDEFRWTNCPHDTFAVNDGKNNFTHHPEAFLSANAEPTEGEKPAGGNG